MASRAAAIYFWFGRKTFFPPEMKKVSSPNILSHPAAPLETELFLVWPQMVGVFTPNTYQQLELHLEVMLTVI